MYKPLPFFNWSLSRALAVAPDNFSRARIKIIFVLLIISLLKAFLVVGTGYADEQPIQVVRAAIAIVFYAVLIKLLLYSPLWIKAFSHVMLLAGLLIVVTNIFVYTRTINLLTVQFVFMMILCSFYTLGSRWGILYSLAGIIPVITFLALPGDNAIHSTGNDMELTSPGFEILAVLNFASIVIAHYFFYKAFDNNVNEKEALNAQLALSVAGAEKLAASKTEFLSTMSHELRTPLNSVIGITELLIQDKPEERQRENLRILHSSSQDLLSLINNVLNINKLDSGTLELESTPFYLSDLVRNICAGLNVKAADKKLYLSVNIDEQLERLQVESDPTRLAQVIYNLAGNAIKFTREGGVTVRLKCINKTDSDVEVLFSVADTGVGIEPGRHAAIFELFTQAGPDTTRNFGGTGLGLAIVKQVLALFNSSIELKSTPGTGSEFTFTVKLPVSGVGQVKTDRKESPALDHLKILVAEDNEVNRIIIGKQLNNLNIHPVIVDNGQQAYEANLSATFDAIFMDLHMPLMNGYETARLIRGTEDKSKASVYLVAFTASVTEKQHIKDSGFDDFLYKPVTMDDLVAKLEKISLHRPAPAL